MNSYNPSLVSITDLYYEEKDGKKWYRFICDYRNRIVHQSIIVKDYMPSKGELLIDLDELIVCQNSIISDLKQEMNAIPQNQAWKKKGIQKKINNALRFRTRIEALAAQPYYEKNGRRYWSMKTLASEADTEIKEMNDNVLEFAYNEAIKPVLEWLLSLIQYEFDNEPQYTVIQRDVSKDEWVSPNDTIEWFFRQMLLRLTAQNAVFQMIKEMLMTHGYTKMFSDECDVETFIERFTPKS